MNFSEVQNELFGFFILFGIALLILMNWIAKPRETSQEEPVVVKEKTYSYSPKEFLCTENERKFYYALKKALSFFPTDFLIHFQIPYIEMFTPLDRDSKLKMGAKRADFVITDGKTRILAIIELDDATHNLPKRKARDEFINSLPHEVVFARFDTESFYEPQDIIMKLPFLSEYWNKKTVNT